jgi:3'-phosphoadenosine 5'-phosphosulfate sulfotransferase (PAPS reductase)/FAD synthetase
VRRLQLPLYQPAQAEVPDLASYDWIVVNSSAGKDSQAMLDLVVELARKAGRLDRVVVVHCDLGRVEWAGTRELAEEQARHYGLRFEVVSRPQGDLLSHIRARGKFPDSARRFCTSDHKRGQVGTLITKLPGTRILNCLGMRAGESTRRSKLQPFLVDKRQSNGRRTVWTWLPIHSWSVDQVWARIRQSGVRHHPAYDLGMPRLSCCFCIFAPKPALMLAGRHNPELLQEYVKLEADINHRFRKDLSLGEVQRALDAGEELGEIKSWEM